MDTKQTNGESVYVFPGDLRVSYLFIRRGRPE